MEACNILDIIAMHRGAWQWFYDDPYMSVLKIIGICLLGTREECKVHFYIPW